MSLAGVIDALIEAAVVAERLRCAEIAETAFVFAPDDPTCNDAVNAGYTIAQLIRDQTKQTK